MPILGIFSKKTVVIIVSALFLSVPYSFSQKITQVNVIPRPVHMTTGDKFYKINSIAEPGQSEKIHYIIDELFGKDKPEGYKLDVNEKGITVKAGTETGLFYGQQTLRQLLTPEGIPYISIEDTPRFPYRGLHLDVSRNFFPKEFVMKMLDAMAFYKFNRFHWHLTDGAGWRIRIDKYPKLTAKTAFRNAPDFMKWEETGHKFVDEGTSGAYGGYYTKEDIREVVAYAQARHITIIPEIEMPGHSSEVFVAYPELCCSGEAYKDGDYCIGNEDTFTFIENVLAEVIELFPSEYIHIGGDEASKHAWKTCPKCRKRMEEEGLQDVDELQSYMIRRIENFLHSKGRKLIGWDEILEGGIAPDATVMSWQDEKGGIKAARLGHDAVMTPQNYLYFDFYVADPRTEPYFAIGGYTPLKRVYSYNPVLTDSLTEAERKHIIGVQANTWTEYIPTTEHAEYMIFPRALALSEVAWSPQESRSWEDFKPRMNAHIPVLQGMGINAFPLSGDIDIAMQVDTVKKQIAVTLDAEKYPAEIRYTTDGSIPTASSSLYKYPIIVKDSANIKAAIFKDGKIHGGKISEKRIDYHRGINKPIRYNNELSSRYMAGGMNALLDGYRGGWTYYDDRWQGYTSSLDCIIDMGETTDVHKVSSRFLQLTGPSVFQPQHVELLTSTDGENFLSQGIIPATVSRDEKKLTFEDYTFTGNWKARYIRLKAKEDNGYIYIFTDEIVIW